jgi:glycosyltransferase involved in cell wall biosynthesis
MLMIPRVLTELPSFHAATESRPVSLEAKRKLNVLHIVGSLGMGGAETWLMELLRLWHRQGSDRPQIDVLLTSATRGIFDDEARQLGAKLHYVRYGRAHLVRFVTEFRRILREGKYDAIHDHADLASGWHFLIGGALPPVRVTHVHNAWMHIESNYAVTVPRRIATVVGKRLVLLLATHVCGTSEHVLRQYGFPLNQAGHPIVSAVHCAFDVTKFNAPRQHDRASVLREFLWPDESKIVLFAGRLDPTAEFGHPKNQKNSWFALNAARAATEKQPSVRLLMAGAGNHSRLELESRIERWGLKDKLRLIGVRQDMARLMRAADVLLFPSRDEGLGMVAVEAQAAGLPVLASTAVPRECVVIPELYDALPLGKPIEIWADALLRIMNKPRSPLEFCRRAVESSPFAIANSARRLEQIYSAIQQ